MPGPADDRATVPTSLHQGVGLLDLISDAVLIRTLQGTIVFWNREAERRIGYSREQAVGRIWHELLRTVVPRPLEELERELLATGSWQGEMTHVDAQGREVRVSSRWVLLRDGAGNPEAVMQSTDEVRRLTRALTELSAAQEALRNSEQRLRSIFDHSPLGIARLDSEFRILDANARFAEMFGAPVEDLAGQSAATLLIPEERRTADRWLSLDVNDPSWAGSGVQAVQRSGGVDTWLHWTASPVRDGSGRLLYVLVMLEDVTAQHQAEQTTIANLGELERLNALKSEFVGLVSHEFRTALTGIQGFSELIRDGGLKPEEMREFASDINKDALRLNRMITEMLELERIEAGKMTLHLDALDLNEVIEDCVARARSISAIHRVTTQLDPQLPKVKGDADRLVQVLSNLLSNAIKYSPEGGEVEVRSWGSANQVVVGITDHGEGIPPEFVERVFERFERYESSPSSRIIGTGLGLPIARQIVELHGGRMWVESRVGVGSIFHFSLPVDGA